jgi:hypothetical protein
MDEVIDFLSLLAALGARTARIIWCNQPAMFESATANECDLPLQSLNRQTRMKITVD